MNVDFKNFRDSRNKLLITYWVMNKGESFTTCDLSKTGLKLGDDNQILDLGCTFPTSGSYSFEEVGSGIVTNVCAGESFNRRPMKAVKITALEDNCKWCYALHFTGLFTSDEALGLEWECPTKPKILHGEQVKILAEETIDLIDNDKNIWIVNPIYESDSNTISYKTSDDSDFKSLDFGKYLKIEKGKTFNIKSSIDTYIPIVYYSTETI